MVVSMVICKSDVCVIVFVNELYNFVPNIFSYSAASTPHPSLAVRLCRVLLMRS